VAGNLQAALTEVGCFQNGLHVCLLEIESTVARLIMTPNNKLQKSENIFPYISLDFHHRLHARQGLHSAGTNQTKLKSHI
jgi:hypothetical protein